MAYPTYTNTSEETRPFEGVNVAAGGSIECRDGKYRYPIPTGFELANYGKQAPLAKLYGSTIEEGITLTGLAQYQYVRVQNASGGVITLTFNEDDTDTFEMVSGGDNTFDQTGNEDGRRDFDKIVITGSGGGNVYVHGWK